jgi:hypothetical protein
MNSASLFSLAGRYDNPIPPRFLAPIDYLKIPDDGMIGCCYGRMMAMVAEGGSGGLRWLQDGGGGRRGGDGRRDDDGGCRTAVVA